MSIFRFARSLKGAHGCGPRRQSVRRAAVLMGLALGMLVALPASALAVPTPTGSPPQITGTAVEGQTLTVAPDTYSGNGTVTVTDQWQDCDSSGMSCTPISGATGSTYQLTANDVTKFISVAETATDQDPATITGPASNLVGVVTAAPPVNSAPPSITVPTPTAPQEGQTLTASPGSWSFNPTFTYQWQRCNPGCADIGGATSSSYQVPGSGPVGATLKVVVTATNMGVSGTPASATSQPIITPPPQPSVPGPGISGTPTAGQTLTANHGNWTNSPTSYTYTWLNCGSPCVQVATGSSPTYTLTSNDVGGTIVVAVTASNAAGPSSVAYSPGFGPINPVVGPIPVPGNTGLPGISGPAVLGQTLTASPGVWSGNPSSYVYQWQRCDASGANCGSITGANASTYTPTQADVGHTLIVSVTANNAGGTSQPVNSGRTGTVHAFSTTSLFASPSAPVAGQVVTLIATVNAGSGAAPIAGAVSFQNGGTPIKGCTNLPVSPGSPSATCVTNFAATPKQLTAAFSPGAGSLLNSSTSATDSFVVSKAFSSTSLRIPQHVNLGNKTRYAIVVSGAGGSSQITPGGTVGLLDGTKPIKGCGKLQLKKGRAQCTVHYTTLGRHRLLATYSGSGNFYPSSSGDHRVRVTPIPPAGSVNALMNWTFVFNANGAAFKQLIASGLTPGMSIKERCSGHGCTFIARSISVVKRHGCRKSACGANQTMSLTPAFHHHRLRAGTVVTIWIVHRNWIGKYYRFLIRGGRKPSTTISCLAVSSTRPGVGCQ